MEKRLIFSFFWVICALFIFDVSTVKSENSEMRSTNQNQQNKKKPCRQSKS